jgi:hypothetical protein
MRFACARAMVHSPFMTRSSIAALINTLEHERHARGALLEAFADELHAYLAGRASPATRERLARAGRGELQEAEYAQLLDELRALS